MTVKELISELAHVPQERQVAMFIGGNKAPVEEVEIDDFKDEVWLS